MVRRLSFQDFAKSENDLLFSGSPTEISGFFRMFWKVRFEILKFSILDFGFSEFEKWEIQKSDKILKIQSTSHYKTLIYKFDKILKIQSTSH